MGALKAVIAVFALLSASSAGAQTLSQWRPFIAEASARFDLPAAWIEQVIRAESAGRTHLNGRPITSHAGAMGLMQLMPGTWQAMRVRLGLGQNPHDPRDNILAGSFYLRLMYARFGYPGLFAAYHAGPGRYAEHLATGRSLPRETRAYLAAITGAPPIVQEAVIAGRADVIFFNVGTGATGKKQANGTPAEALFVALSPR
ncbi:MAG: lytic transglycosylase [Sphingobium sp. 66-54]|nr:MAG: lytic transglycosylase [Sphingobium sp. 66-54]